MKHFQIFLLFLPCFLLNHLVAQNVGIGTAAPAERLHVAGDVRVDNLANPDTSLVAADVNGTLILLGNGAAGQVLTSTGGGTAPTWSNNDDWHLTGNTLAGTEFIGSLNAQPFVIRTNNQERARVAPNGFVGVATNTPGAPLEVVTTEDFGHIQVQPVTLRIRNASTPTCNFDRSWDWKVGNCGQLGLQTSVANSTTGNPRFNILNSTATPSPGPSIGLSAIAPVWSLNVVDSGYVGVNLQNPGTALHVNIDSAFGHITDSSKIFRLSNQAVSGNAYWDWRLGQDGILGLKVSPTNGAPVWNMLNTVNSSAFLFDFSSTAINVIQTDANGNVGMGAYPSGTYRWELTGNGGITETATSDGLTITETNTGQALNITESDNGQGILVVENGAGSGGFFTENGDGAGFLLVENGNGNGLHVISQSLAATDRQLMVESDVSTLGSFGRFQSNGGVHFFEVFSGRDGDPNPYVMVNQGEPIRFVTSQFGFCENAIIQPTGNLDIRGALNTFQVLTCSDRRLKKDFAPIESALASVKSLNGVYFNWKTEMFKPGWANERRQIGFIAQEVEAQFPEMVTENEEGYLTVDYSKMTPVLLEAVKEQQEMIDELRSENEELKERLLRLEKITAQLGQ